MSNRKCIFTGKRGNTKTSVIPRNKLKNMGEMHNWVNQVPCNIEYKRIKSNNMPDELELQANEYFRLLELAKLRVEFYTTKLAEIQKELQKRLPEKTLKEEKKDKDIKKAIHIRVLMEETEEELDNIAKENIKTSLWDENE